MLIAVILTLTLKLLHCVVKLQMKFFVNNINGEELLRAACTEKASPIQCKNGLLLQGMVRRLFAAMYYSRGEYDEALIKAHLSSK